MSHAPVKIFAAALILKSIFTTSHINRSLYPLILNTLEISFDELSHDTRMYSYTVKHLDYDWTHSVLSSYEYLKGYTTADIDDYALSLNTQQIYTNYRFTFPNEDMQLLVSGNYVLLIYEDGDVENVVAQVCFSVVEPSASIDANIRGNTDKEFNGRYQQLDLDINTTNLDLRNPQEIKIVVRQNNRLDNEVVLEKPTFVEPNRLRYTNQAALIFEGGNEFRHFDTYSHTMLVITWIGYATNKANTTHYWISMSFAAQ